MEIPTEQTTVVKQRQAIQANAYVWYVAGFLEVLLLIRLIFLLLGAHNTGFTSLLYSVTHPLVVLFQGIFPAPKSDIGYFDVAALLAMGFFALVAWGIASLVDVSKGNITE